jgi:monoamine oxidase
VRVGRRFLVIACVTALGCGPGAQTGVNRAPGTAGVGRYDVIVVGAGMAGLTAAKRLASSRRSVLVLEASDRVGGRALADTTTFSVPVDYGAAWIHGVHENPLTGVVDGLGFHRVSTELEGPLFVGDHRATPDEEKACATTTERLEEALAAAAEAGRDVSVSELLPPDLLCSDLVGDNVGRYESAAELADTSAVDAALFDSGNDDFVREGVGTFVAAYGKEVPVRLRSPVTRIRYDAEGVALEIASGQRHFGKRALVTVSTGVLRSGTIAFDPPLPRWKLDAIAGLPMGFMDKVVLEFKRDIFPATPANSWVLWDGPGHDNAAFVVKPFGAPIAIAFTGGDQAKELEKDDGAAIDHAKLALRAMYGASVDSELLRTRVTHWGKDPWTLGAYSAALPGASKMHAVLALPVDDRVFFAGEACAPPELNGSLGGAYHSALKASAALDRSLSGSIVEGGP